LRKNNKTRKNVAVNRNKGERFIRAAKYFGFVVLPVLMVVVAIFMAAGIAESV